MALVFSLSAALLAILVQQWVRDYMHVFQQFSDSLKSARLGKYLHERSEGWYMPLIAMAVPALLHASLFLFLTGLCDFAFNINTVVGPSTTVPIGISGLLYIFTIFVPIIYPQSSCQNLLSRLIWYPIQILGYRQYKDWHSHGESRPVSSIIEGQMQLAMEEPEDRNERDERANRWLLSDVIEDAEMEMEEIPITIPGSFKAEWLEEVRKVSNTTENENKGGSPQYYHPELTNYQLFQVRGNVTRLPQPQSHTRQQVRLCRGICRHG